MSRQRHNPQRLASGRRGLTLVEVVTSTLIVGLMTVAALHALGAATRSSSSTGNRAVALGLADDLMSEVLATEYDDLGDFNNLSEDLAGDHVGWTRNATVQRVQPANVTQATPGGVDQGAIRIHVSVEYDGRVLAEQYAIRTSVD